LTEGLFLVAVIGMPVVDLDSKYCGLLGRVLPERWLENPHDLAVPSGPSWSAPVNTPHRHLSRRMGRCWTVTPSATECRWHVDVMPRPTRLPGSCRQITRLVACSVCLPAIRVVSPLAC